MQLVAQQGEVRWLVWRGSGVPDPTDPSHLGVIVDRTVAASYEVPVGSALARGYWEAPSEQPDEATLERWLAEYPVRPWRRS